MPSSALKPAKRFCTPATSTAKLSAIAFPLLIRPHGPQPVVRQHYQRLFTFDVQSEEPLCERARQEVKEDRTDERLKRKQWMHGTKTSHRHLRNHVGAHRAEGRRQEVMSGFLGIGAERAELQEDLPQESDARRAGTLGRAENCARDLGHDNLGPLVA